MSYSHNNQLNMVSLFDEEHSQPFNKRSYDMTRLHSNNPYHGLPGQAPAVAPIKIEEGAAPVSYTPTYDSDYVESDRDDRRPSEDPADRFHARSPAGRQAVPRIRRRERRLRAARADLRHQSAGHRRARPRGHLQIATRMIPHLELPFAAVEVRVAPVHTLAALCSHVWSKIAWLNSAATQELDRNWTVHP